MTKRITAFTTALVLGSVLAACAQSPRGPVTSTIPPASKPLAVDPALLQPGPAAANQRSTGDGSERALSAARNDRRQPDDAAQAPEARF